MAGKRSPWSRFGALLGLEASAESLEAYQRASVLVQELQKEVEDRRLACVMDGVDPWSMPPGTRAGFLCAWNAIVLQALGDAMLDADADGSPWTAGHVPEITRNEVEAYYGEVELWVNFARQAFANPDYRLDVAVPATLPEPEVRPVFNPLRARDMHLWSVLAGMRAVGELAAAAMALFPQTATDPARQRQIHAVHEQFAHARDAAQRAQRMYEFAPRLDVPRVLMHARIAIERFYGLGQLIAAPMLAAAPAPPAHHGFDIWCLTDPGARDIFQADPTSVAALQRLWDVDPDPARTLALQVEIRAACGRGDVDDATDARGRIGHFYRCPWVPVYVARHPLTLGAQQIPRGQQFILDMSAREGRRGGYTRLYLGRFERMVSPIHGQSFGARYVSPRTNA